MSAPRLLATIFGARIHRLRLVPSEGSGRGVALVSSVGRPPAGWVVLGYRVLGGGSGDDLTLLVGESVIHTLPPPGDGSSRVYHLLGLPATALGAEFQALEIDALETDALEIDAYELGTLPLFVFLFWLRFREVSWRGLWNVLLAIFDGQDSRGPGQVLIEDRLRLQRAGLAMADSACGMSNKGAGQRSDEKQRGAFLAQAQERLDAFLASSETLVLPGSERPCVSIVLVLHNKAELTLACLESLACVKSPSIEVVVWDNASTDRTRDLLERLAGAVIISSDNNLGFVRAVNEAAKRTRGESAPGQFMLLLNNDAYLEDGSLEAALVTLESSQDIGVVGGRVVLLDGRLQEAGSIVWRDGSCQGYGRGDDPEKPKYLFRRDVDYVSGVFFLVRRQLWEELGGFDDAYAPAYYEEVDFCLRAWCKGWRVVYEPTVRVTHYEFGSVRNQEWALDQQERNRALFARRHREALANHLVAGEKNILAGRCHHRGRLRVLVLDDMVPHIDQGSGCPRLNVILRLLLKQEREVTFYPTQFAHEATSEMYRDLPRELEILVGLGTDHLVTCLGERRGHYDALLVSRPHNMEFLRTNVFRASLLQASGLLGGVRVIYDAEAIFALREGEKARILGRRHPSFQRQVRHEISLAADADRVTAVSARERSLFIQYLSAQHRRDEARFAILPHAVEPRPTSRSFDQRRRVFLFVGPLRDEMTPNIDAVLWFLDQVLPQLRQRLESCELVVAGRNTHPALLGWQGAGVRFVGRVDDLDPFYDEARVFVAPTRFAAGVPLKVYEAAARGLPVVATDLLAKQLDWQSGEELLSSPVSDADAFVENCLRLATDEALWQRLRSRALARVAVDCSTQRVEQTLRELLAGF